MVEAQQIQQAEVRTKPSHADLYEMNIRVGPVDDMTPSPMPLKLLEDPVIVRQTQEAAISAILEGYTVIVYNFIRDGNTPLAATDTCEFRGFNDLEQIFNEQTE